MFEAEYKLQITKIASLEQELMSAKNAKLSTESELEAFKRKAAEELRVNNSKFKLFIIH